MKIFTIFIVLFLLGSILVPSVIVFEKGMFEVYFNEAGQDEIGLCQVVVLQQGFPFNTLKLTSHGCPPDVHISLSIYGIFLNTLFYWAIVTAYGRYKAWREKKESSKAVELVRSSETRNVL